MKNPKARAAGLLLPLSALPSDQGCGSMGAQARRFVDLLAQSGAAYWQILPINALGYGNSPYQPFSSFAGDPIFIDLDDPLVLGLLGASAGALNPSSVAVEYERARAFKLSVLRRAFPAFRPGTDYASFAALPWVRPYAVFKAFKNANGGVAWPQWPRPQRDWPELGGDLTPFEKEIAFESFVQYLFYTQWNALKAYANQAGVRIIGDVPIYVGLDSQDVWAGRENFLLDEAGNPTAVAGVPPDQFSALGQRWGNPLYDWARLQQSGFRFWIDRLRYAAELFDVVRIDHFRAFDTYWEIPASEPTAVRGAWREAPGYALFDAVLRALPAMRVVVEDLGDLRPETFALRDHYHFPGMKILQYTFEPGAAQRPGEGEPNMVAYTGTHDNQTVRSWFEAQSPQWRQSARESLEKSGFWQGDSSRSFVSLALADAAELAILPVWDLLGLDDRARINTPGTLGSPNWEWKLRDFLALEERLKALKGEIAASGRV
ncbi:MAG: 4-alpha-glucanotransferase [Christensenellaceae bacterium]|jgi:4-alpha-glucanotransferase|nr:4-alpha-glucanotransferase [Christensenellaceae bacterium]